MMSESDLRQALEESDAVSTRTFEAGAIARRGRHLRRSRQSGAVAATLGVAGIVTVTGVAVSAESRSPRVVARPGGVASPVAASSTPTAVTPTSPMTKPTSASVPTEQRTSSAPPAPLQPPKDLVITDVPIDGGTVAYTLRPEQVYEGNTGIVLNVAGADGTLTKRYDCKVSSRAVHASWCIDDDPAGSKHWILYGVVPAGSTDVKLTLYGRPTPATALTKVPGATSLAFYISGTAQGGSDGGIGLSLLTFRNAHGSVVVSNPLAPAGLG